MGAPGPDLDKLLPQGYLSNSLDHACYHEDNGRMSKMIRPKHAENISTPHEYLPEFKVKQNESCSKWTIAFTKHSDFLGKVVYPEAWKKGPLRLERMARLERAGEKVGILTKRL